LVLEIHSGEGGEDSKLFVYDLLNAYLKYSAKCGFKSEILTQEHGHARLKIMGKSVWNRFKNENGKHIVQRVPTTERNGRRQTSVITVAVIPPKAETILEPLNEKDLEIKFQTGKQKAGGQNVNRIKSACRMRHKPTGLEVFINGRDQGKNKEEAIRILTKRVNDQNRLKIEGNYNFNRKNQMQYGTSEIGGRGDKSRTYNYIRGEIIDNNLGKSTRNIKSFMKGNFEVLFDN
jgi:peptide chain release factor 1